MKLSSDIIDEICKESLKFHIEIQRNSIAELRKKKKLKPHQAEDLGNQISTLDSLEVVYNYFGGDHL